jgi:hypothetical protein
MKGCEKNPGKKFLIILLFAVCIGLFALVWFYRCQAPAALNAKKYIKYNILHMAPACQETEAAGLTGNVKMALYLNGEKTTDYYYDEEAGMERVYSTETVTRLVDYHDGYSLDLPAGITFDFSRSGTLITGQGDGFRVTVTKEYSPYGDLTEEMTNGLAQYGVDFPCEDGVDQYIAYYQCRFLLNADWQENNGVTVSPVTTFDAGGHRAYLFHAVISDMTEDRYDAYTYVFIRYADQDFMRIVIKYDQENTELRDSLEGLLSQFGTFTPFGSCSDSTDYQPELPESWSQETLSLYERIAGSNTVYWGIYTDDIYGTGISETVPSLEEALDYTFPVVLSYMHSVSSFPSEFMEENWENGRIVELTYQLTENNNEDLCGYSPLLELYRGGDDSYIRELAQAAKAFGHPFLFRLCNEMNSDWTSYGGVNNMADPEVFVTVWQQIYEIFLEEGVDNCIWIFNPNDRNCPPSRWNDGINYYPGNDYVQMLGVTGYNNGTYYAQWAEEWREFDTIYDSIENLYTPVFEKFPWIITEFSSSSVGGDKAAWIEHMFDTIGNYPNIKVAVWFSSADYDSEGNVARPYWLNETPETLAAFKKGLSAFSSTSFVEK